MALDLGVSAPIEKKLRTRQQNSEFRRNCSEPMCASKKVAFESKKVCVKPCAELGGRMVEVCMCSAFHCPVVLFYEFPRSLKQ